MRLERAAVIGAGAWGTALAQAAAMAGRSVALVGRDREVIEEINQRSTNSRYLGATRLSERITAVDHLDDAADFIILAVPAQQTRQVIASVGAHRFGDKPVVLSAKGLEANTLKRQSEVLAEVVPDAMPFALSGPSFAEDVAAGRPTAVTLAGDDASDTSEMAAALAGPALRPYAADDRIGVELAGALKNIYALAAGAVEGAAFGASARSALIARAFAEMSRFVTAMGGSHSTLAGLAGLGDLTLSCTSVQSRNYRAGIALGRGEALPAFLAEGVATAPVAQAIAADLGVDAPLVDAVNLLLSGRESIDDIVAALMARPLKKEN